MNLDALTIDFYIPEGEVLVANSQVTPLRSRNDVNSDPLPPLLAPKDVDFSAVGDLFATLGAVAADLAGEAKEAIEVETAPKKEETIMGSRRLAKIFKKEERSGRSSYRDY